jgi:hypothetical protein
MFNTVAGTVNTNRIWFCWIYAIDVGVLGDGERNRLGDRYSARWLAQWSDD